MRCADTWNARLQCSRAGRYHVKSTLAMAETKLRQQSRFAEIRMLESSENKNLDLAERHMISLIESECSRQPDESSTAESCDIWFPFSMAFQPIVDLTPDGVLPTSAGAAITGICQCGAQLRKLGQPIFL